MVPIAKTIARLDEIDVGTQDAVLCDLDGCLIAGDSVFDGAADFVERAGDRLWIVSNNSTDTALTLSARLNSIGLAIGPERILLAGEQTLRSLATSSPRASISLHASVPLRLLAAELDLSVGARQPDFVILARDMSFTLRCLSDLLAAVRGGAELLVTNVDTTHPDKHGRSVPETGALLAAVTACEPGIGFRSLGKPAPDLIDLALEQSGVEAARAIFVGDNVLTDGKAALAAGVRFVHINRLGRADGADERPANANEMDDVLKAVRS